jgi:hypothetical protein
MSIKYRIPVTKKQRYDLCDTQLLLSVIFNIMEIILHDYFSVSTKKDFHAVFIIIAYVAGSN